MNPSSAVIKQQLRKQIRKQRKSLPALDQSQAAIACTKKMLQIESLINASTVAIYLQNDGEVDTQPLIQALWELNKKIFLPIVEQQPQNHLRFAPYLPHSPMKNNRIGIAEPDSDESFPISSLDIMIMPLVAFDESGNRLGMGGGYYDRTLAGCNHNAVKKIGLAYDFQKVNNLVTESWDQPLDMIVTDKSLYQNSR